MRIADYLGTLPRPATINDVLRENHTYESFGSPYTYDSRYSS